MNHYSRHDCAIAILLCLVVLAPFPALAKNGIQTPVPIQIMIDGVPVTLRSLGTSLPRVLRPSTFAAFTDPEHRDRFLGLRASYGAVRGGFGPSLAGAFMASTCPTAAEESCLADLEQRLRALNYADWVDTTPRSGNAGLNTLVSGNALIVASLHGVPAWLAAPQPANYLGGAVLPIHPAKYALCRKAYATISRVAHEKVDPARIIWEGANEPGLKQFYAGSANDYAKDFKCMSDGLRDGNPNAKVWGPGTAGPDDVPPPNPKDPLDVLYPKWDLLDFLMEAKKENVKLDGVTWHLYAGGDDPHAYEQAAAFVRDQLTAFGYDPQLPQGVLEWNHINVLDEASVHPFLAPNKKDNPNLFHMKLDQAWGASFLVSGLLSLRRGGVEVQTLSSLRNFRGPLVNFAGHDIRHGGSGVLFRGFYQGVPGDYVKFEKPSWFPIYDWIGGMSTGTERELDLVLPKALTDAGFDALAVYESSQKTVKILLNRFVAGDASTRDVRLQLDPHQASSARVRTVDSVSGDTGGVYQAVADTAATFHVGVDANGNEVRGVPSEEINRAIQAATTVAAAVRTPRALGNQFTLSFEKNSSMLIEIPIDSPFTLFSDDGESGADAAGWNDGFGGATKWRLVQGRAASPSHAWSCRSFRCGVLATPQLDTTSYHEVRINFKYLNLSTPKNGMFLRAHGSRGLVQLANLTAPSIVPTWQSFSTTLTAQEFLNGSFYVDVVGSAGGLPVVWIDDFRIDVR